MEGDPARGHTRVGMKPVVTGAAASRIEDAAWGINASSPSAPPGAALFSWSMISNASRGVTKSSPETSSNGGTIALVGGIGRSAHASSVQVMDHE